VKPNASQTNSDSGNNDELAAAYPTTAVFGEKTNEAHDSPCPPKKKKKRVQVLKARGRKHHLKFNGGPTSSHRESRRERRAYARGLVKIPK